MQVICKVNIRLMGSDFELIVVADTAEAGNEILQKGIAEIQRIEELLTLFKETSETTAINRAAGIVPVVVSAETYTLIERCLHISAMTQGAFDISAGALRLLYNFKVKQSRLPDKEKIKEVLERVGHRNIQLRPGHKVYLEKEGMSIGFGAIGKGYAADKVKTLWLALGVKSGVINASGDLTAWGVQPDGSPWRVGVANPDDTKEILLWLPVDGQCVATSGNYEQYFDAGGIRYSHNIDPRTGLPARFIKSVTIVSPSAELSDALATAVTIMGKDAGMNFINQLPGVHCIMIGDDNQVSRSKKIEMNALQ